MSYPPQAMEGIADVDVGDDEARKHDFVDTINICICRTVLKIV